VAGARLRKVLVNFCETLVAQRLGLPAQICVYAEFCGKGVALEHDGSVYSCDHYVYPEYRLGNVQQGVARRHGVRARQVRFGYAKSETLPAFAVAANSCPTAGGECPKNRLLRSPDGEPGTQLPVRRAQAVLRARGARGGQDRRQV